MLRYYLMGINPPGRNQIDKESGGEGNSKWRTIGVKKNNKNIKNTISRPATARICK